MDHLKGLEKLYLVEKNRFAVNSLLARPQQGKDSTRWSGLYLQAVTRTVKAEMWLGQWEGCVGKWEENV